MKNRPRKQLYKRGSGEGKERLHLGRKGGKRIEALGATWLPRARPLRQGDEHNAFAFPGTPQPPSSNPAACARHPGTRHGAHGEPRAELTPSLPRCRATTEHVGLEQRLGKGQQETHPAAHGAGSARFVLSSLEETPGVSPCPGGDPSG